MKLLGPLQMAAPPMTSMPSLIEMRPRSVHACFMTAERHEGFSPLARNELNMFCAAIMVKVLMAITDSFSCTPCIVAMGTLNCFLTRAYPPTASTAILLAARAPAGSEMPRPSPRHSMSMFHPSPAFSSPPMMHSMGTKKLSPLTVPFMNGDPKGSWRGPVWSPGMPLGANWLGWVGRRATVMPSLPLVRSPLGSLSLKARPTTVATGASVM
mmetsp:Transcript_24092/g.46662  ORF Transcript_24092/g.46662 Transcript_24092/m.46662 type:complete len:212 (+) Transcript_24092:1386-2021(+)